MATVQSPKELLRARFVGKSLHQVPTPAVVLDLAKVENNCNIMLRAAQRQQLNWRAHIKTHKVSPGPSQLEMYLVVVGMNWTG